MPLRSLVIFSAISAVLGYETFVALNPNGDNVPDGSGGTVSAIGHVNPDGGGPRNKYGAAFSDAGNAWTAQLCFADSDGDGFSNGAELGDPCCVWTSGGGSPPLWGTGISHPGDASSTPAPHSSCSLASCPNGIDPCTGLPVVVPSPSPRADNAPPSMPDVEVAGIVVGVGVVCLIVGAAAASVRLRRRPPTALADELLLAEPHA